MGLGKVVLCIARKDDKGEDHIFPSLIKAAKQLKIPSIQPDKLNSEYVLSIVKNLDAELVLSLQNNRVFGKKWVDLFFINLG